MILYAVVAFLARGAAHADGAPPKGAKIAPGANPNPILKARTLDKWGDRAGALRILAMRLETEPSDVDARTLYGTLLWQDGRYDDAGVELARVLRTAPMHREALVTLIRLELANNHPDRARKLATDGLQKDPAHTDLLVHRARACLMLWRPDEAATDLDRLLSVDANHSGALELRERVRAASERRDALTKIAEGARQGSMNERALSLLASVEVGLELLSLMSAKPALALGDDDPKADLLANARALSRRGDRDGAIELLAWHLEAKPTDTDARTLYGTILSWDGRYDEARQELAKVLRVSPGHFDASRAALRVELWSDHPERAEDIATRALDRERDNSDFLLERARARFARDDFDGAMDDLDRLLTLDPKNQDAARLRIRVQSAKRVWAVGGTYTFDSFSDRQPWHEATFRIKRRTPLGSVIMRGYEAWRSYSRDGLYSNDSQFELEAYPRIREGTYANVGVAVSPNAELYPKYRLQIDVYQSLPLGFEVSLGYRHLQFSSGVDMGVVTAGKYLGDWFFTLRSFITPGVAGTSVSASGSVRRYFFDGAAYVGVRYGHGISKEELRNVNDISLLASNTGAAEAYIVVLDQFEIGASGAVSQETRVNRNDLWQYDVSTNLGFRF